MHTHIYTATYIALILTTFYTGNTLIRKNNGISLKFGGHIYIHTYIPLILTTFYTGNTLVRKNNGISLKFCGHIYIHTHVYMGHQ